MAEITRVRTTKTRETLYRGKEPTGDVVHTERVRVASVRSERFDVTAVLDLANALEHAGIVKGGLVTAEHNQAGHLVQLVVEADVPIGQEQLAGAGS